MRFTFYNGPMPTTAVLAAVATGTAIKTMLQIKAFNPVKISAWGFSLGTGATAIDTQVELLDTGTINATVTAAVDADVMKENGAGDSTVASVAGLTLATSGTGYTSSAEGSITAVKLFDSVIVQPLATYAYQFPLGQEPLIIAGNIGRIRVKAPVTINMICWMKIEI